MTFSPYNKLVIKLLFLLFTSLTTNHILATKDSVFLYDFESEVAAPCDDGCYKLKDLIKHTWEHGYSVRINIQSYLQQKFSAEMKLGSILPHINISTLVSINEIKPLEIISSFAGFVFPNRWLDWSSSKYIRKAEYANLLASYADSTSATLFFYYTIQQELLGIKIVEHYIRALDKIIEILEKQQKDGLRQIKKHEIERLRSIKGIYIYQEALINNLQSFYPQLTKSTGLSFKKNRVKYPIETTVIHSILDKKKEKNKPLWVRAEEYAPELESLNHQIRSIKKTLQSAKINFLDPEANASLGYGYIKQIGAIKTQIVSTEITVEKVKADIFTFIGDNLNFHNDSIQQFQGVHEQRIGLHEVALHLKESIIDPTKDLNSLELYTFFRDAFTADVNYCYTFYNYLIAKANLDRYAWRDGTYLELRQYFQNNMSKTFKEVEKKTNILTDLKNKMNIFSKKPMSK